MIPYHSASVTLTSNNKSDQWDELFNDCGPKHSNVLRLAVKTIQSQRLSEVNTKQMYLLCKDVILSMIYIFCYNKYSTSN